MDDIPMTKEHLDALERASSTLKDRWSISGIVTALAAQKFLTDKQVQLLDKKLTEDEKVSYFVKRIIRYKPDSAYGELLSIFRANNYEHIAFTVEREYAKIMEEAQSKEKLTCVTGSDVDDPHYEVDANALPATANSPLTSTNGGKIKRPVPVVGDTVPFNKLVFHDSKALGNGAFSVVFRVSHRDCAGSFFAYKKLGVTVVEREIKDLKNEADIHRQLCHPNVVRMYGIVFEEGNYGLLLKYMCYGSLDQFLERIKEVTGVEFKVSTILKTRMSSDICSGMLYLHSILPNPVIHGDLKIQNVLLGKRLNVRISDFGLAKWKDYSRIFTQRTLRGTASHIPPEHWDDDDLDLPKNEKFDIYSFGILLWEFFTEETAFAKQKGAPLKIMKLVVGGKRPPLNKLPDVLSPNITAKITDCWQQDPDKRPTFKELLDAFKVLTQEPDEVFAKAVKAILEVYSKREMAVSGTLTRSRTTQRSHDSSRQNQMSRQSIDVDGCHAEIVLQRAVDVPRVDRQEPETAQLSGINHKMDTVSQQVSDMTEHSRKMKRASHKLCDFLRRTDNILEHMLEQRALTSHECDEIRSHSTINNMIQHLIDLLSCKQESSYLSFLDALSMTDQNHLFHLLEEGVDVNAEHKEVLIDNYSFMMDHLDTSHSSLLEHLLQSHVLNIQEFEEIRAKNTKLDQFTQLLNFIMRTSEDQYKSFLSVLVSSGFQFISNRLESASQTRQQPKRMTTCQGARIEITVPHEKTALKYCFCNRWQHRGCSTGVEIYIHYQQHKWACFSCRASPDEYSPEVILATEALRDSVPSISSKRAVSHRSSASSVFSASAASSAPAVSSAVPQRSACTAVSSASAASSALAVNSTVPQCSAEEMDTLPPLNTSLAIDVPELESTRLFEVGGHTLNSTYTVQIDATGDKDQHKSVGVEDIAFNIPNEVREDSLDDSDMNDAVLEERPFQISCINGGSKKGRARLVDSLGFAYTLKSRKEEKAYWACPVHGKGFRCPATVIQCGTSFIRGKTNHNHPPKAGTLIKTKVQAAVREEAMKEITKSGQSIVQGVLQRELEDHSASDLSTVQTLVRMANRKRQGERPADPQELNFIISPEHVPQGFVKSDVRVGEKRHIVMATEEQITLPSKAKRWYLDGTFRVVKHPFSQLFSVHAFVRHQDSMKQVPLVFVLMSGKKKEDYAAVLKEVVRLCRIVSVESFVVDFEAGIWQALRDSFPSVTVTGCVFHWTQAVWRKVQALGLQTAYTDNDNTHRYIRRLLALPFLPAEHIELSFRHLQSSANDPRLVDLVAYIESTWIESTMWGPTAWSIFMQSVRTNNDVEGWHRRLNSEARRCHLPLYTLVGLLHREAELVNLQVKLVKIRKLSRYQRKKYRKIQGRLEETWARYSQQEIFADKLLQSCSKYYDPMMDN